MPPDPADRRKYPRVRAPKGMIAGWKSAGEGSTSRVESMGLGGLYLLTANPLSTGSPIELVLELPTGEFHARAIVRRSTPGRGMGVQFIRISPEDRAKLNLFVTRQGVTQECRAGTPAGLPPKDSGLSGSHQLAISPAGDQAAKARFEREVMHLVEVTGKGTYYQLLGVTSESPRSQIKKSYYLLARKFHPDSHPGNRELTDRLVSLMTVITEAYRTLDDETKRAAYDESLAAIGAFDMGRSKTETEESVEDWLARATECINAKNFVGSIVWLCKCVEAAPEQALYHAMLGRSLRTIPQYQNEAIQQFRKAIDLDPWKEPVYVQLAELLEEMRLPESAAAVYSKLLEINPAHGGACKRLAALAAERKQERPSAWISQLFGGKS